MAKKYIFIIALFFGTFIVKSHAQTFKIACGEDAEGEQVFKEIYEFDFVSEKPTFPGGEYKLLKFINATREYPQEAYDNNIQGRVVCSFIVECNGTISHLQILKGVEESLNNEAIRIIEKMPKWIPGRVNGLPVPVRVIYPIVFRK